MKKILMFLVTSVLLLSSFTAKAPVKGDPTTAPYYSSLLMDDTFNPPLKYIDIWVRWASTVVLSRDYYADIKVQYNDGCGFHTTTYHIIIPKGGWEAFYNTPDLCAYGSTYIASTTLVGWGPN